METYVKPKVSIVLVYKSIKGGHISVALKKTQKWKCVFNDEIGKYILSYHNVKLSIGKELFSFTFEVIQEGGEQMDNGRYRKFYEQGYDDGYDNAEYSAPDNDDEGAYTEGYEDGQIALESDMIGDEW